jgi:hypothetical protein
MALLALKATYAGETRRVALPAALSEALSLSALRAEVKTLFAIAEDASCVRLVSGGTVLACDADVADLVDVESSRREPCLRLVVDISAPVSGRGDAAVSVRAQ